jgi:predicted phosphodiesterase
MRIALISDIHGNAVALDAVLADALDQRVETYWFLGDYTAIGPEPGVVLDRLADLDHASFTRGNTDRYVVTGETPPPALSAVQADPALVPLYAAIAASFAWTRGFLTAQGRLAWIAALPLELRLTCADGTRVLGVHASPGNDDGEGLHPGLSDHQIDQIVSTSAADLICVGHTHEPMVRQIGQKVIVNLGSVSNPKAPDLNATYVVLDSSGAGTSILHRSVDYDRNAFAETVRRSGHPVADYILRFQRGEVFGRRPHPDHAEAGHDQIGYVVAGMPGGSDRGPGSAPRVCAVEPRRAAEA